MSLYLNMILFIYVLTHFSFMAFLFTCSTALIIAQCKLLDAE